LIPYSTPLYVDMHHSGCFVRQKRSVGTYLLEH